MNQDDFFYLGKILKPIGGKGDLLIILDVDNPSKYQKLESVFIGIGHDRVPFFFKSITLRENNRAVIRFEDVNSTEEADIFRGKELFLPVSMLPQLKGKKFYFHEIKGFNVIDTAHGNIGIVQSVLDLPHQSLLQILFTGKEILIPMTDEVILKIDRRKKEIRIQAPEGLIEIYL